MSDKANVCSVLHPYMSSNGEMNMSLRLMTCGCSAEAPRMECPTYVLVSEMLQELQFPICPLRQDRRAEGFHDLFDRHGLAGELILCGAVGGSARAFPSEVGTGFIPDQPKGSHPDRLQVSVPGKSISCGARRGGYGSGGTCL